MQILYEQDWKVFQNMTNCCNIIENQTITLLQMTTTVKMMSAMRLLPAVRSLKRPFYSEIFFTAPSISLRYKEYLPNLLETGLLARFVFFELETSNFGCSLIFYFAKLCKVWARLNKLDIVLFKRFWWINGLKKSKGGPL